MLSIPQFKREFNLKTINYATIFLVSERGSVEISNPTHQLLASYVDGNRKVDEIVEEIIPDLLPENPSFQDFIAAGVQAFSGLVEMQRQGYIVECNNALPSNLAAFCDTLNVDAQDANHRLQTIKVAVKAYGSIGPSDLITSLESLGIQVCDEGDFEIVLTDDYLHEELEEVNKQALQNQRPWMLVKPVGTVVWLGPIFSPQKTGCWECLAQRLRGNRPIEEFIRRHSDISTPLSIPQVTLPSTLQTALGMVATEVFKWVVRGENKRLEGILVTYDTLSLETQNHSLVKRPQCPVCGEIQNGLNRTPMPLILGHRKKVFTADGGHRCLSPEETLKKYQHQISPITGVVRELINVSPDSNQLLHIYAARHHFASMFDDLHSLRQNVMGRSAGKGRTDAQARASALGEAVERYSGVFQGDEIRHKSSYQTLEEKAIHPNLCMNFSPDQYHHREEWNASCSSFFQRVPEPFDEEREIDWTPVWSLTHEEPTGSISPLLIAIMVIPNRPSQTVGQIPTAVLRGIP